MRWFRRRAPQEPERTCESRAQVSVVGLGLLNRGIQSVTIVRCDRAEEHSPLRHINEEVGAVWTDWQAV